MKGCIVEMLKLLTWSENTYKQKKKLEWEEDGRNEEGVKRKRKKRRE
jgi:hypothetical protein